MSIFGSDYKGRKNLPIFNYLTRYFPKATVEIVKVCVAGNVQHNPELDPTDINWSRGKSTDQLNTAMRHMIDHATTGPRDTESLPVQKMIGGNTYHLAKAAWRIMAELELQIEKDQAEDFAANDKHRDVFQEPGTFAQREAAATTASFYFLPDCPICGDCKHVMVNSNSVLTQLPANEGYHCSYHHPIYYFGKTP